MDHSLFRWGGGGGVGREKRETILTNLFLCNDVLTYAIPSLVSPALSNVRTMRRNVLENAVQGSLSVKRHQ